MMLVMPEPGLRSQMPPGLMAVPHDLRRVVHDDFDAERGRDMSKAELVTLRRGGRGNQGECAQRCREQQHLTHRSPPSGVCERAMILALVA
jgi:hypothetical protein